MSRPVRLTMVTIHNRLCPLFERRAEVLEMVDKAGREGSDIVVTIASTGGALKLHYAVTPDTS